MQFFPVFSYFAFILALTHSVFGGGSQFVKTYTSLNPDQLAAVNKAYDTYGASLANIPLEGRRAMGARGITQDEAQARYNELNAFNDKFRGIQFPEEYKSKTQRKEMKGTGAQTKGRSVKVKKTATAPPQKFLKKAQRGKRRMN
ncbi:hypothetical protein NMY22_g9967 [Coprinellus aureogranulatus]|nr:hypothetical protein NMY22_g9967 [Coprinellus aureogranulatus]